MIEYSQIQIGEYSDMRKAGIALIVSGYVTGMLFVALPVAQWISSGTFIASNFLMALVLVIPLLAVGYYLKDRTSKKEVGGNNRNDF